MTQSVTPAQQFSDSSEPSTSQLHSDAPTKRRSTWKKDPVGRRNRILVAATQLFGENGYRSVKTGEIARTAGVAEGTVFHHFGTKRGLLEQAASRYGTQLAEAMFAGVDTSNEFPVIEDVVRHAFSYVRNQDPAFGRFLFSDEGPDSALARHANRHAIIERLRTLFEQWQQRGSIAKIDSQIVAEMCFGLVETALRQFFGAGPNANEGPYVETVVAAVDGMLKPTASHPA